jgi:dethiobiotin synthetase
VKRGRIVLIGTGTGIGKTHLGVALVHALAQAGQEVAGLKPVESGVADGVTDADLLDRAATFHVKHPRPYALATPVSPHRAAALEGVTISLSPIVDWVDQTEAAWIVLETAGALLSPLSPLLTNLDLTFAVKPDAIVLVAPDRLGVLHEVTATLFALRILTPQLPEPVVALQAPAEPDASTGKNAEDLLSLSIARTVATFPRAAPESDAMQTVARELLAQLGVECFT